MSKNIDEPTPPSPSQDELLDEILDEFNSHSMVCTDIGCAINGHAGGWIKAKAAINKLYIPKSSVREAVPKKLSTKGYDIMLIAERSGYNRAIQEINANLKERGL